LHRLAEYGVVLDYFKIDSLPKSHVERLMVLVQELEDNKDRALADAKKDYNKMIEKKALKTIGAI
jgi:hypothetical protein